MRMKSIKTIFRRGKGAKEPQGQQPPPGDDLSRSSSITNLNAEQKAQKGALSKSKKSASKDKLDKIPDRKSDAKKGLTKNNNKIDDGISPPEPPHEIEILQRQLQEMANEKSNLALQLGEQKDRMRTLHMEMLDLKKVHDQVNEENNLLRNRLKDVAHSPLSDNEKQQLLLESHRHHSSAPASIATNLLDDGTPGDVTACPTPDWDKQSSGNVSEVSVACLQDKINQMQETHYSTNEELQATLQELTDLQRQLTEVQQDNEQLIDEKNLMFDSLCRQTERLNESKSELENLRQLFNQDKDDQSQYENQMEHEQKLVDLLKDAQEERELLLFKHEQLNNELQDARAETVRNAAVIEQLTERVNTLECTLDAKYAEHKQLEQELAMSKDQSSGRQIEIDRLTDLLDNARTKIGDLEQDRALSDKSELDELLDIARKEKDALESEIAHLKEQVARSRNETEKLKDQVSILQEECKVTRNNAKCTQSELEYKCEKLHSEKVALSDQLQQLQDAANGLQVQAQCQLEDKRQLSAVLSETQKLLSDAERKNNELEVQLTEIKRLRKEENDEWEKFQNDLLTSVRVANDFKTEAQQDLQKMIMENKTHREKVRQLEVQIDKLRGQSVTNSSRTEELEEEEELVEPYPQPAEVIYLSQDHRDVPKDHRDVPKDHRDVPKDHRDVPEDPKVKAKSPKQFHFIKKPKIFRNTKGYHVSASTQNTGASLNDEPPFENIDTTELEFHEVQDNDNVIPVSREIKEDTDGKMKIPIIDKLVKKDSYSTKQLSPQEQKDLKALNDLYAAIDPTIPYEDLTAEQRFILKLKKTYDSNFEKKKLRPIANKSKEHLAISKPLLSSVFSNPKLKQIVDDPTVRLVEDEISNELYRSSNVFYPATERKSKFDDAYASHIQFQYYDVEDNRRTVESFKPPESLPKSRSMNDLYFQNVDYMMMSNFELKRHASESSMANFVSPIHPATYLKETPELEYDSFSDTLSDGTQDDGVVPAIPLQQTIVSQNNEHLSETLDELYLNIDPNVPEPQLSKEQIFVKKMKESMEEMGRKNTLKKQSKRNVKISGPTKESVWSNAKLASVIKDTNVTEVKSNDGYKDNIIKKFLEKLKLKKTDCPRNDGDYYVYDHEQEISITPVQSSMETQRPPVYKPLQQDENMKNAESQTSLYTTVITNSNLDRLIKKRASPMPEDSSNNNLQPEHIKIHRTSSVPPAESFNTFVKQNMSPIESGDRPIKSYKTTEVQTDENLLSKGIDVRKSLISLENKHDTGTDGTTGTDDTTGDVASNASEENYVPTPRRRYVKLEEFVFEQVPEIQFSYYNPPRLPSLLKVHPPPIDKPEDVPDETQSAVKVVEALPKNDQGPEVNPVPSSRSSSDSSERKAELIVVDQGPDANLEFAKSNEDLAKDLDKSSSSSDSFERYAVRAVVARGPEENPEFAASDERTKTIQNDVLEFEKAIRSSLKIGPKMMPFEVDYERLKMECAALLFEERLASMIWIKIPQNLPEDESGELIDDKIDDMIWIKIPRNLPEHESEEPIDDTIDESPIRLSIAYPNDGFDHEPQVEVDISLRATNDEIDYLSLTFRDALDARGSHDDVLKDKNDIVDGTDTSKDDGPVSVKPIVATRRKRKSYQELLEVCSKFLYAEMEDSHLWKEIIAEEAVDSSQNISERQENSDLQDVVMRGKPTREEGVDLSQNISEYRENSDLQDVVMRVKPAREEGVDLSQDISEHRENSDLQDVVMRGKPAREEAVDLSRNISERQENLDLQDLVMRETAPRRSITSIQNRRRSRNIRRPTGLDLEAQMAKFRESHDDAPDQQNTSEGHEEDGIKLNTSGETRRPAGLEAQMAKFRESFDGAPDQQNTFEGQEVDQIKLNTSGETSMDQRSAGLDLEAQIEQFRESLDDTPDQQNTFEDQDEDEIKLNTNSTEITRRIRALSETSIDKCVTPANSPTEELEEPMEGQVEAPMEGQVEAPMRGQDEADKAQLRKATLSRNSSASSYEEEMLMRLSSTLDQDELVLVKTLRRTYNRGRPSSDLNEEDMKIIEMAKIQCLSPDYDDESARNTLINEGFRYDGERSRRTVDLEYEEVENPGSAFHVSGEEVLRFSGEEVSRLSGEEVFHFFGEDARNVCREFIEEETHNSIIWRQIENEETIIGEDFTAYKKIPRRQIEDEETTIGEDFAAKISRRQIENEGTIIGEDFAAKKNDEEFTAKIPRRQIENEETIIVEEFTGNRKIQTHQIENEETIIGEDFAAKIPIRQIENEETIIGEDFTGNRKIQTRQIENEETIIGEDFTAYMKIPRRQIENEKTIIGEDFTGNRKIQTRQIENEETTIGEEIINNERNDSLGCKKVTKGIALLPLVGNDLKKTKNPDGTQNIDDFLTNMSFSFNKKPIRKKNDAFDARVQIFSSHEEDEKGIQNTEKNPIKINISSSSLKSPSAEKSEDLDDVPIWRNSDVKQHEEDEKGKLYITSPSEEKLKDLVDVPVWRKSDVKQHEEDEKVKLYITSPSEQKLKDLIDVPVWRKSDVKQHEEDEKGKLYITSPSEEKLKDLVDVPIWRNSDVKQHREDEKGVQNIEGSSLSSLKSSSEEKFKELVDVPIRKSSDVSRPSSSTSTPGDDIYEPIYENLGKFLLDVRRDVKRKVTKTPVPSPRSRAEQQSALALDMDDTVKAVDTEMSDNQPKEDEEQPAQQELSRSSDARRLEVVRNGEAEEVPAPKQDIDKGAKKKVPKEENVATSSVEDTPQKVLTKSSSMEILYDSENSNQLSATSTDIVDQSYLNLFKSPEQMIYENLSENDPNQQKSEAAGLFTLHYFKAGNLSSDESSHSTNQQDAQNVSKVSFLRKKFESEAGKDISKTKQESSSDDSANLNPVRSVPKTPNLPKAVNTTTVGESGNSEVPQCSIVENSSLENLRRNSRKSFENARSVFESGSAERPTSAVKVRSSRVISSTVPEEVVVGNESLKKTPEDATETDRKE